MKTKEFVKRVKELGFEVEIELGKKGEFIEFRIGDGEEDFVIIWPKITFAISTIEYGFVDLKDPLPLEELYKLCFEYASTPVKDREEEKKFYLRHKWIVNSAAGEGYLNWFLHDDIMILSSTLQDSSAKTQFTLKEIEKIKEKLDTDLNDFELVEVSDD